MYASFHLFALICVRVAAWLVLVTVFVFCTDNGLICCALVVLCLSRLFNTFYVLFEGDMADNELQKKLQHRQGVNEGSQPPSKVHQSVYSEFKEFSIPEIKEYKKTFQKYDVDKSNFIDFMELKMMMEKLGEPQTHLALKDMIKAVDEDCDGQISFREFMLIFKKAKTGELQVEGLKTIAATCDVTTEGVGGAKNFFEAKVKQQSDSAQFEQQIKAEQEQKKLEQEEAQAKRAAFKEKASMWK